jgi:hypothetical protein
MGRHIPICFVTLERGLLGGTLMLCMLDDSGSHQNFGSGEPYLDEDTFVEKALSILRDKFGVHPLELPPHGS